MHVLITGGGGMIGRKLSNRLAAEGLNGQPVDHLTLVDVTAPPRPVGFTGQFESAAIDLSSEEAAAKTLTGRPDVIFHLAAIVSGEAEVAFEKGYRINLDGTRGLLETIRKAGDGYKPRFIYSSSVAVFGAPFPEPIPEDFHLTPLTSYGTQKVIGELLLADYHRHGFVDGVGLRLPTISVRPGKPNKAASGFFSSIIREPLAGADALLPVPAMVRHTHASPRAAVGFLIHAAGLKREQLGLRINLTMPGVSCTVEEQIAALRRIAGDKVASRIRSQPDPLIMRIVSGWPEQVDASRARKLGFRAEETFDEIVRIHVEDELGGKIAA